MDDVDRDLAAVQKALREREKRYASAITMYFIHGFNDPAPFRHGASVEEMTIEVNRTQAAWDNAKKEYLQVVRLNKVGHLSPYRLPTSISLFVTDDASIERTGFEVVSEDSPG